MSSIEWETSCEPSTEQINARDTALRNKRSIITGQAGTGKTTAVQGIAASCENTRGIAFTGRAAKRLTDEIKLSRTCHSFLGKMGTDDDFSADTKNAMIVIDEASMLTLDITAKLVRYARPFNWSLVLVGDANQLPPIGCGQVFHDLLEAGKTPVTELTHNYRSATRSGMVEGAKAVLRGEVPVEGPGLTMLLDGSAVENVLTDIRTDVRVGTLWAHAPVITWTNEVRERLNNEIQEILNPLAPGMVEHEDWSSVSGAPQLSRKLRVGDPVVHLKNDRDRKLVNGDFGVIIHVETSKPRPGKMWRRGVITAQYDDIITIYDGGSKKFELDEFDLAYSFTCHKFQGCETDLVRVCLPYANHHTEQAWLYTAMTRGKSELRLYSTHAALAQTARQNRRGTRRTNLVRRIGV